MRITDLDRLFLGYKNLVLIQIFSIQDSLKDDFRRNLIKYFLIF